MIFLTAKYAKPTYAEASVGEKGAKYAKKNLCDLCVILCELCG
jgi:hypothetical protein